MVPSQKKMKVQVLENQTLAILALLLQIIYILLINGQIIKIVKDFSYNISTTNYTYDSKNGIFKNVKGFSNAVLGLYDFFGSSITQNNFDKIESTTSSKSGSYNNSTSYKHTYEYNANNYPTKITTEYKYNSTSSSSYTYNITYNK